MSRINENIKMDILKQRLPHLKDENLFVTVNHVPNLPDASFVQIDEFTPEKGNTFSTNADTLRSLGYAIWPTKDLLRLPHGKYRLSDLKSRSMVKENLLLEKHKRPDGKKARSFISVFRYKPSMEVLLVMDKKGRWTMPGGQLDMTENYEDAAWRELKEETGVVPKDLNHWKKIETEDKITDVYYTEITDKQKPKAGSDAKGVKWFSVDELDDVKEFHKNTIRSIVKDVRDTKKEIKECMRFLKNKADISFKNLLIERKKTVDGYLIVMEGIDGAGKSTQCDALEKWLHDKGWKVTVSKWNNSPHITDTIKKGKKEKWLSPTLFCLLNASDMVWRYENVIKPALEKGHVVICDRFYYTSYVRDSLRGVSEKLLDEIYSSFPEPDLLIHFSVPPELAMKRLMKDKGVKWYSAGMDIGYDKDEEKCALEYEKKMDGVYRKILPKVRNYKLVNTERDIKKIFKEIKEFIREKLQKVKKSKFKNLIKEAMESHSLNERMSYKDLYDATDDERIDRSRTVRVRPLQVTTENNNEMWKFSYTSAERSEYKKYGGRSGHKGNIHFFKDSVDPGDNAEDLDCMVDCDCRDFKFRWAYANAQDDASFIGGKSLNKAINRAPVKTNPRRYKQLCKHLAGLAKYLTTNMDRARQRARLQRRPVNIFEDMDKLASQGQFETTYDDYNKKTIAENIEKVGYSPDEEYSDMPIDWDAQDVQILDKWNINSIRQNFKLPLTFVAIYPAIIDVNELDPKLAEEDPDAEEEKTGYDWEEFRFKKRGFPPILVMRDEHNKLHIMDGNHRTYWAQQNGHRTIGAWVVDKLIQKDIDRQKRPIREARIINPAEAIGEGYITLYHGTTWPIALKAKRGELGPQNLRQLVSDVLVKVFHETPEAALKYYDDEIRHHSTRNAPSQDLLFLTTDKNAAVRYAKAATKYGGEIFLDILGQYVWDKQGQLGQDIHELVRKHLLTDEPAVVTINVPLSMVFSHPNWNTPMKDRLRDIINNARKHPELKKHLNDLSMEVFVKEKIPARFVQRIDRTTKFGEEDR